MNYNPCFNSFAAVFTKKKTNFSYYGIFSTILGLSKSQGTSSRLSPLLIVIFTCVFLSSLH